MIEQAIIEQNPLLTQLIALYNTVGRQDFWTLMLSPGGITIIFTILWVRFQRVFAIEDGHPLTKRQIFSQTLIVGAVIGNGVILCLQGMLSILFNAPFLWPLNVFATLFSGFASIIGYEAARVGCAFGYRMGFKFFRSVYDWISVKGIKPIKKDEKKTNGDSFDEGSSLTEFMQPEDTTERKE